MLSALMEKADNMQEQMGNISREMETKKESKGTARNQKHCNTTSYQSEWPSSKNLQTINAGESVEKREPSCTVDGNVN